MKSLILKDSYVVLKQMKVFLVMLAVMAVFNPRYAGGFVIMFSVMLPTTAMSFDDQSKWEKMAAMMPYRTRDLVLSKYAFGAGLAVMASLLCIGAAVVVSIVKGEFRSFDLIEEAVTVAAIFMVALILMDIELPLLFKLGSEKGRMLLILITMGIAMAAYAAVDSDLFGKLSDMTWGAIIVAATAAVTAVSIWLSMRIYEKKNYV